MAKQRSAAQIAATAKLTEARRAAAAAAKDPHLPGPRTPDSAASRSFYSPEAANGAAETTSPLADSVDIEHVRRVRAGSVEGAGATADAALAGVTSTEDAATLAADIARVRALQRPLGTRMQKLAYAKRPGYHRHWFNDSPGRIDEATDSGWAHVNGRDHKPVNRVVGAGRDSAPLRAYLMEIPEIIWLEDMAARHEDAEQRMQSIKANPFRAAAGSVQASDRGKFYSPTEAEPLTVVKRN